MLRNIIRYFAFILFVISILNLSYGAVSINTCQVINESLLDGSRIVDLSSNINFNSDPSCLNIDVSNAILDCKGFSILGVSSMSGIYVGNVDNVTVRNCDLVNANFLAQTPTNSFFYNLNFTNTLNLNYYSFRMFGNQVLTNNTIDNINIINGRMQVSGKNLTVTNIFASNDNFSSGFVDSSYSSYFENITLVGHKLNGYSNIRAGGSSASYATIKNLNVSNNGLNGIYTSYSVGNKFYDVVGNNNLGYGYHIYKTSNSAIYNSSFENNVGWDVLIDPQIWTGHCGHSINNVTATGGYQVEYYGNLNSLNIANKTLGGLILCNVDSSTFTNITIDSGSNDLNGIFIKYSDSNVFDKITSSNNYNGFYLESTNSNTFTNSVFKNNFNRDFGFVPFLSNNHNYKYSGNVCVQTLTNVTGTGDLPIGFYSGSSTVSDSNFNELIFCNSESILSSNIEIGIVDGIKNGGLFVFNPEFSNFTNITVTDSHYGLLTEYSNGSIFNNLNLYNNDLGVYIIKTVDTIFMNSIFKSIAGEYLFDYYDYNYNNVIKNSYIESANVSSFKIGSSRNTGLFYNNIINSTNYYYNAYRFNEINLNITKSSGTSIVGGPWVGGNYWTNPSGTGLSDTCTDINKDSICDIAYSGEGMTFDMLPLTNSYEMFIGQSPECYFNNSWDLCTNLDFSDNLEQVRNSCVSNIGSSVSGMTVSLKNIDDNKYYFENSVMTFSSGNYSLSSINNLINDSGDFVFEFKCSDVLSNNLRNDFDFSVAYGDVLVELLTPSSNISVLQNSTFTFTSKVTCLNRECGDLVFSLDPINESDIVYTKTVTNNSNSYNSYGCSTSCIPDDSDEGYCTISDLGFDFTLYNTTITSGTDIYVTTNGRIKLSSTTDYSASGSKFESEFMISALWSDYDGDNIYICPNQGISPNKYTSVVFDGSEYSYYTEIDNEIILYESGDIEFNFGTTGDDNTYLGASGISNDYYFNYDLFPTWNVLENAKIVYSASGKGGLVPMDSGTPFFTTSQNPVTKSDLACLEDMFGGEDCSYSWSVNVSGDIDNVYEMFTYATGNIGKVTSSSIFVNISTVSNLKEAYFIEPTLSLVQTSNNWSFVNVSSNLNIVSCQLNWSGVLEPMVGSGSNCYINKSELSDTLITYNVVVDVGSENLTTIFQQFDFVGSVSVPVSGSIDSSVTPLPSFGFTSLIVVFFSILIILF